MYNYSHILYLLSKSSHNYMMYGGYKYKQEKIPENCFK